MTPRGVKTAFVPFTKEMDEKINQWRVSKLYSRQDFYKIAGLKGGVNTMDYWRRNGRISFSRLKVLIRLGAIKKEDL